MKHKMIGCSDECLKHACCDFCIYVIDTPIYDSIVGTKPIGCRLHRDKRHQEIADGCGCCPDFHCFRADENNMVVKETED